MYLILPYFFHKVQTLLLLDYERALSLSDAQIVSNIFSVCTASLVASLKENGVYDHTQSSQMTKDKAAVAINCLETCRRVIASYLTTPSTAAKTFRTLKMAHNDWDSKFLKKQVKPEVGASDSDHERDNKDVILIGTTTKRNRKPRAKPADQGTPDTSPRKKIKTEKEDDSGTAPSTPVKEQVGIV